MIRPRLLRSMQVAVGITQLTQVLAATRLPHCISAYPDNTTVCYPDFGVAMCKDIENSVTHDQFLDEDALAHCEAMCSGDGVLPFMVGVNRKGMQKSFANKLCLGMNLEDDEPIVLEEHPTLVADCQDRIKAVGQMLLELGEFIVAYERIGLESTRYGERVRTATAKVNEHMQQTLEKKFREGLISDKIQILLNASDDVMKDVMPNSYDRLQLITAIENMADAGEDLIENLKRNVPKLDNFQAECVQVTALRAGQRRAHIQSICATSSSFCFSTDDAKRVEHISCCCAGIPAIMTELQAKGTGMDPQCYADGIEVEADPRRLDQRKLSEALVASACTHATSRLLADGAIMIEEMKAEGLSTDGIEATMTKLKEVHCADDLPGRRLQLGDVDADMPAPIKNENKCYSPPDKPAHADWPADQHVLRVSEQLFDGQCEELGIAEMNQKCTEFCGADNVPFVLGTPANGFSHAEADELCLKMSGEGVEREMLNPNKVETCLSKANNMQDYKNRVAALEAELGHVSLELLSLTAMTGDAKVELMEWMRSAAPALYENLNRGEEYKVLEAYQARIESLPAGSHRQARKLKDAVGRAKAAADELGKTLEDLVEEAREFVKDCNVMVTGWDAQRNYMLDLCTVAGDKCLNEENSNRITCCCGVLPLGKMGQNVVLTHTIPGLDGLGGRRLSDEAEGRRLSEEAESICEIAEAQLSQVRKEVLTDLEQKNHPALVQEYQQNRLGDVCETTTSTSPSSVSSGDVPTTTATTWTSWDVPNYPDQGNESSEDDAFQSSLLPAMAAIGLACLNN